MARDFITFWHTHTDSDEEFEDVPLWKRALMKKKAEEDRKKRIARKKEVRSHCHAGLE